MTVRWSGSPGQRLRLILGAGLMMVAGSFANDPMLPALPVISADFGAGASQVQWLISAVLLGIALGQFFVGSLSDAFGRRPVFLIGLSCMVLASFAALFAPSLETLIAIRFVQGLAVSSGIVLARAVLGDLFHGREATSAFSALSGMLGIGPVLAPIFGALLLGFGGWRLVLVGIAVVSVVILVSVAFFVPESLPAEERSAPRIGAMIASYRALLRNRRYWSFGLVVALGHAGMIMYLGSTSFITQNLLGLSPFATSLTIAAAAMGMVSVGFVYARIGPRFAPERALWAVQLLGLVVNAAMLAVVLANGLTPVLFVLWGVVLLGAAALVLATGVSLAIAQVKSGIGAAAAALGVLQYGLGAVLMPVSGLLGGASALPVAIGCVTLSMLAIVARLWFGRPVEQP